MVTNMDPGDINIIVGVFVVVALFCLIADFVILCYWISFKNKEYNYQRTYGPVLRFPPRTSDHTPVAPPVNETPVATQLIPGPPEFDFLPPESRTEVSTEEEPVSDAALTPGENYAVLTAQGAYLPQASSALEPEEEFPPIDPNLLEAQAGVRSPFAATWSLVHPFVSFQFVLVAITVISFVLLVPGMLKYGPNVMTAPYGIAVIVASLYLQNVGFVGITAYFVRSYGSSLSKIGLRKPTLREIGLGLAFGVALLLISNGLESGLSGGLKHLVSKPAMDHLEKMTNGLSAGGMFEGIHTGAMQLMFGLAGALAAPIGEEVFFRGLLYNALKRRWGVTAGVVISAICFAAIHGAPLAVIVIIPMGIALALAYEYTGSLWVTIIIHAVNNSTAFIQLYSSKPGH